MGATLRQYQDLDGQKIGKNWVLEQWILEHRKVV